VLPSKTDCRGPGGHQAGKNNTHPALSETFAGLPLHDVLEVTLRARRNLNSAPSWIVDLVRADLRERGGPSSPRNYSCPV
jgi:hypothetical protein